MPPYDKETDATLRANIWKSFNTAENAIQAGMRRMEELDRRATEGPIATPPPPVVISPPPPSVPPLSPVKGFSDFKYEDWLDMGGVHTTLEGDPEGAFRLTSNVAKYGRFDPIVFPGQNNVGHLHMFWGNFDVDHNSTYESLIASGHSSGTGDMINRSSYWIPPLLFKNPNADGDLLWQPDYISNYYKMLNAMHRNNPWPDTIDRQRPLPEGLKLIFGNSMTTNQPSHAVKYTLFDSSLPDGQISSMDPAVVLHHMKPGMKFSIALAAPSLWNGAIDSPDHRSHLAYPIWDGNKGHFYAPQGYEFIIPSLTYIPMWTVPYGVDVKTLRMASDMPNQQPLLSAHGDFMDGWHPVARQAWYDNALRRVLNCSGADLGNGFAGKRPAGFTFIQRPQLIPIAHEDTGHMH